MTSHLDVPLLETVVGAPDAEEEEREEDDGTDDEKDLKLPQGKEGRNRFLLGKAETRIDI